MKPVVLQCATLVLALAATQFLGGCASLPAPAAAPTDAPDAAAGAGTDQVAEITGSRIPTRRTEKMVSQIGGQDYKEYRNSLPAPLIAH